MKPMPSQQLNPRIKAVWRLSDGLWTTGIFLVCFIPFLLVALISQELWAYIVVLALLAAYVASLIVVLLVLPPIRHLRWRYEISPEYVDIARGIIWRKRFVIPFIRVQNTDTRQGPILRAFGLASVTISTAAGSHEIPGLGFDEAELLRDRAAELARLAREDV